MRPVGSVFLLRAAPGVAQQSNPSMAVSATLVAHKDEWLVRHPKLVAGMGELADQLLQAFRSV